MVSGFVKCLLGGALLLVAAGCGRGNDEAAPLTSTSRATAAATTTPRPAQLSIAAVPAGTSLLAFVRGNDLWIASLDGTTLPPRAVTAGAKSVGYAGVVHAASGARDLYYVAQRGEAKTDPVRGDFADFVLYRLPLAGGNVQAVLRYSARPLEPFNIPSNASISPDGRYVAYSDKDGLALVDVASGTTRRLLENEPCAETNHCFSYHDPEWSPTGDRLRVTKLLWEGGLAVVVDPFARTPAEVDTKLGSFYNTWSPDGRRLCLTEGNYAFFGALMIYDVATGQSIDATANVAAPTPHPNLPRVNSYGCACKRDETLAVGYAPLGEDAGRIAVLDKSLEVAALSDPIAKLRDVVDWLPDESGVLFNKGSGAGIYRPAAGVSDPSFQADRILALIP